MGEPLYYNYPIIASGKESVLSCKKTEELFAVELDSSIFFPEGGGQLSDKGTIDGVEVREVKTVNGRTVHYCTAPVEEGKEAEVRLDVDARWDHSRQHTGEHILSGLANKLFGAVNVGFHMAEDYCTIDFDIFLEKDMLEILEKEANAAVMANRPVTTLTVGGAEAMKLELRKHADKLSASTEAVRIVYIDEGRIDSCTCCGTHVQSTGEVGAIMITDSQKYKGGTRLWFSCGGRAVEKSLRQRELLSALARMYSTSEQELRTAIKKQVDDLSSAYSELKLKSRLLAGEYAEKLLARGKVIGSTAVICEAFEGMNANDLKLIGENICSSAASAKGISTVAALLFARNNGVTEYRMVCSPELKFSMKELCSAVNAAVNGKGGGSPVFAQGKTNTQVDDDTVAMLRNYMERAIKG